MIENQDAQNNEPYQTNVAHILLGVCSFFGYLAFYCG